MSRRACQEEAHARIAGDGEGSYEVAGARNRRQAELIIDPVVEYARRLMAGGLPPRD